MIDLHALSVPLPAAIVSMARLLPRDVFMQGAARYAILLDEHAMEQQIIATFVDCIRCRIASSHAVAFIRNRVDADAFISRRAWGRTDMASAPAMRH